MGREVDGRKNARCLWAVRILTGLFLFCGSVLGAQLPECHCQELPELSQHYGQELAAGERHQNGIIPEQRKPGRQGKPEEGIAGKENTAEQKNAPEQPQDQGKTEPPRQAESGGSNTERHNSADFNTAAEETGDYVNPDTSYRIFIEDYAGLLTEDQRLELSRAMQDITAYGNVAFLTTDRNAASTESLARSYYMERFGTDSGTVFVIDMDNRNIWIHSDGAVYKVITSAYADTVTDNVYRYASNGDYYGCAREAFAQITALLEGQRIAQPMKYISNALLAMILALLANFGLVICLTRLRKPGENALLSNIYRKFRYTQPNAVYTHQTKTYDPISSGGGSSGGGRSGGGGGGGGGRSGGGGGHSF